jgi:hypothetical protein
MKHFTWCGGSNLVAVTLLLWQAVRFWQMLADKVAGAGEWSCVDTTAL